MTRGQSAMIFQFGWLNRVRAERGAEGTPCPAARALEDNRGRGRCGSRGLRGARPGEVGSCRPAGPGRSAPGRAAGGRRRGRSVPQCRCEAQARGDEGHRRCGDVLEEKNKRKKKPTKKIYGGNELFFFIEPSAMHQRVFLSLYVKRLLRKILFLL